MKPVTPNFYFISETSKLSPVCNRSFKKIYQVETFHTNILKWACSNSEKSVEMIRKQETCTHVVKSFWNQVLSCSRTLYWNTCHDVTESDFYYLLPYYSLAIPYLKVPSNYAVSEQKIAVCTIYH